MDILEAIYTTRSMRRLAPDPIPEGTVERLLDAAVRGPSGGNQQVFRFLTVTDPDTKSTLQTIYRECLTELNATQYASIHDATRTGDQDDPDIQQSQRISSSANWLADNLDVAPMLIFVFGKDRGETSTMPCLWNLCLVARAEGLGTTLTTLLKIQKERVESLLGVPEGGEWHMHAMIPIGYPTGKWGVAKRRPAHLSVYSERWGERVSWTAEEPLWPQ